MKKPPHKLEIFLFLAVRHAAENKFVAAQTESGEVPRIEPPPEISPAFAEQLAAPDFEKFERLRNNYLNKTESARQKWRESIGAAIADDDFLIDDNLHRSHVEAALHRESPAIRKIIETRLPTAYRADSSSNASVRPNGAAVKTVAANSIERVVAKIFADQFVALRDLPQPTMFDRLSGAQIARLAWLAGIRETAFACARIESLESVGAFLRRFAPEDARAVAAQLSGLPKIAAARLAFAETLVESALAIEPQPTSAMLDWLGIRLVGIMLCAREFAARVAYAEQKLPLETAPKLSEVIETECRNTPPELARKIGAEIEQLAVVVAGSSNDKAAQTSVVDG